MKLDRRSYEQYLEGFFLLDCVVRKKDILYFVVEQEYDEETNKPPKSEIRTRVIVAVGRPGVQPWGYADLGGMQRLMAGVSYQPKEQFVGVSLNDHVYVHGSGDDKLEADIPNWNEHGAKGNRGGTRHLRTIGGYLYAIGGNRSVIRREGREHWQFIGEIPFDSHKDKGVGFADMDGFSSQDMYAAGGQGDVWHYNGTKWRRLPFPSNMDLYTVCCAGDGFVYIGAESGSVFKGRGNEWKLISRGKMSLPFRDLVWHQGKVWGTSDYGLWVVENDKVTEADVPDKVRGCSGHLSVGDGVMLLAGIYGAALNDGKSWQMIIDFGDLD